jgi:Mrp family chromosome partitioning ATPase
MNEISPLDPTIPGSVWRYKWLVALAVIAGGMLGVAYTVLTPPVFRARADLVVEDPGAIGVFETGASGGSERYVADQVEILSSPAVEARAEDIAAASLPEFSGDIDDMSTVEGNDDSSLIVIRVAGPDGDEARMVADSLVGAYQQIKQETSLSSAGAALQELDVTLAAVEADIERLQAEIANSRSDSERRAELDAQFDETINRFVDLTTELETTGDPVRAAAIRVQLADILLQVQTFQEIQVAETTGPSLTPLITELEDTLQRRADLQTRRDQIAVDSQLAGRGIALVSPAKLAPGDGRAQGRAGVIGGILGLLAGSALAYTLAIKRRSFAHRAEPEFILNAPIISEIPRFVDEGLASALPVQDEPTSRTAEAFRFAATALDIQSSSTGAKTMVAVSGAGEEGKTTVVANTAMAAAREGNRVLVIDADFGSQALSQMFVGEIPPAAGITEVVETGMPLRRAVVTVPVADGASLSLLSRGHRPVIAANFFRSASTRVFFESVREEYDLVLIDTPPLLYVAYTSIISRYADAALVIVNHGGQVSDTEEVADRLEFIGIDSIGYIYNQAPLRPDQTDGSGSLQDILGARSAAEPATYPNGNRGRRLLGRIRKVS